MPASSVFRLRRLCSQKCIYDGPIEVAGHGKGKEINRMGDPLVYRKSCPWAYFIILMPLPDGGNFKVLFQRFYSYGSRPDVQLVSTGNPDHGCMALSFISFQSFRLVLHVGPLIVRISNFHTRIFWGEPGFHFRIKLERLRASPTDIHRYIVFPSSYQPRCKRYAIDHSIRGVGFKYSQFFRRICDRIYSDERRK